MKDLSNEAQFQAFMETNDDRNRKKKADIAE